MTWANTHTHTVVLPLVYISHAHTHTRCNAAGHFSHFSYFKGLQTQFHVLLARVNHWETVRQTEGHWSAWLSPAHPGLKFDPCSHQPPLRSIKSLLRHRSMCLLEYLRQESTRRFSAFTALVQTLISIFTDNKLCWCQIIKPLWLVDKLNVTYFIKYVQRWRSAASLCV